MASAWITVGFSTHRVETLEAAAAAMAGHRLVVLEEPPTPGFEEMLAGAIPIDDHLERLGPGFPEYSRRQCALLQKLHAGGVEVAQIEPFMAGLEAIHDHFERGGRPEDLEHDPVRWPVYQAEKRWTAALIGYYAASSGPDFDRVVEAVCTFARADAERGALRDALRAAELARRVNADGGVYAEAGSVHATLVGELRRRVPRGVPVRPRWLMAQVAERIGGRSLLLAPGDRLTLAFCGGRSPDPERARLLAARSLIQVAIAVKEEMVPTGDRPFPHTSDDLRTRALVEPLGYEDCRALWPAVRARPPDEARATVERRVAALAGR